jgi:hypothetical protein
MRQSRRPPRSIALIREASKQLDIRPFLAKGFTAREVSSPLSEVAEQAIVLARTQVYAREEFVRLACVGRAGVGSDDVTQEPFGRHPIAKGADSGGSNQCWR